MLVVDSGAYVKYCLKLLLVADMSSLFNSSRFRYICNVYRVTVAAETFQMEMENTEPMRKRTKFVEEKELTAEDGALVEVAEEETEANPPVSEQMEAHMSQILEKIDNFTQQVSEFLESGKSFFKDLSNEFEERVIAIHKEQMEKWQEEIKELRFIDASNEEINAVLQNAQQVLYTVHNDP
ncbi:hypothetical protein CTI12_AA180560 [Artemisia annua]|uniref:Uncharacterized protein n=1 Tax=Artemisia annua TaxID=35608 RepID=A0A2U1P8H7_ARTAN|nr:hypothetical protein CTI12_AA180560 [Artemisia annua]